jgi:hypothetical protein
MIQSNNTSLGTLSASRRRNSMATQPACESAAGTTRSAPLASITDSASSTKPSDPKSSCEDPDCP